MPKTPTKAKQTMSDVAPPGTTSAGPTARPIITGHRTAIKDPMVQNHDEESVEPAIAPSKKRNPTVVSKTIQPTTEVQTDDKAADTPEAVLANAEATVGTVVDQFKGGSKPVESEEQAGTDVASLIASRQYVVPIGTSAARKQANSIALALLVCLVVAAFAYAWMMDILPF